MAMTPAVKAAVIDANRRWPISHWNTTEGARPPSDVAPSASGTSSPAAMLITSRIEGLEAC